MAHWPTAANPSRNCDSSGRLASKLSSGRTTFTAYSAPLTRRSPNVARSWLRAANDNGLFADGSTGGATSSLASRLPRSPFMPASSAPAHRPRIRLPAYDNQPLAGLCHRLGLASSGIPPDVPTFGSTGVCCSSRPTRWLRFERMLVASGRRRPRHQRAGRRRLREEAQRLDQQVFGPRTTLAAASASPTMSSRSCSVKQPTSRSSAAAAGPARGARSDGAGGGSLVSSSSSALSQCRERRCQPGPQLGLARGRPRLALAIIRLLPSRLGPQVRPAHAGLQHEAAGAGNIGSLVEGPRRGFLGVVRARVAAASALPSAARCSATMPMAANRSRSLSCSSGLPVTPSRFSTARRRLSVARSVIVAAPPALPGGFPGHVPRQPAGEAPAAARPRWPRPVRSRRPLRQRAALHWPPRRPSGR